MQGKTKVITLSVVLLGLACGIVHAAGQINERILVQDNSAFAMDLYQKLRVSDGNIFLSPYSISTALAMTYGGARGNTEKEMAKTLRFSLDQDNLHQAFAQEESRLNKIQKSGNIKLSVANSLWPQQDYKFLDQYLSLVKKNYGVSITPVDYKRAREAARKMINRWVEDKTQDKIRDLIQPGTLDALTRLALVNAIYFKGDWQSQFKADKTKDAPFHISSGKFIQAPMMTQQNKFKYADLGSFEMLELPYVGNEMSMIVLLPKEIDGLKQLEDDLSIENLEQWKARLNKRELIVFLPKFKMTSMFRLDNTLKSMGMVDAFSSLKANFAGMDGRPDWLHIGAVIHKAFVDVNEEGTEAAAATAVVVTAQSMPAPIPVFHADHPFIFLIQDNETGSILFYGENEQPNKNRRIERTTKRCSAILLLRAAEANISVRIKMKMEINPIGKIHSPFKEPEGMPIQPTGANGVQGTVEIFDKFKAGLKDLEGFSHIILLYIFHRSKGYNLQVTPFMDDTPRGVFATRAPKRPNPIGLSVVKLERIENGILHVQNIDILDETPLLDIKPYVQDFDRPQNVRSGWIAHSRDKVSIKKSDDRFK